MKKLGTVLLTVAGATVAFIGGKKLLSKAKEESYSELPGIDDSPENDSEIPVTEVDGATITEA